MTARSILEMLAADPNLSPAFADAIRPGPLNPPQKHLSIFGRPDLFSGVRTHGWGSVPRTYSLMPGLTIEQQREALHLVLTEYPYLPYGTCLLDGEITVHSGE